LESPRFSLPEATAWIERYRPHLRRLAEHQVLKLSAVGADPSDVVQETLLKGFRQLEQFRGNSPQQLLLWLEEILRNQIVDTAKYARRAVRDVRREQTYDEAPCPRSPTASQTAREKESHELVQQALLGLPEAYREVLLLRQQFDLPFEDIGQRMNRTPDAARMLWGRAIMALGRKLKEHE
jgi:RNA polymerase sigma-70 factor (ECF subfamily)